MAVPAQSGPMLAEPAWVLCATTTAAAVDWLPRTRHGCERQPRVPMRRQRWFSALQMHRVRHALSGCAVPKS